MQAIGNGPKDLENLKKEGSKELKLSLCSTQKIAESITWCLFDVRGFYLIADGNGFLTVAIISKKYGATKVNSVQITKSAITCFINDFFGYYVVGDMEGT